MRIAFSATNPCHLWPMARALHASGQLARYYSGYPAWRLPGATGLPVRTHSARTVAVYGLLRFPERWRPKNRDLFLWQDLAFDRWVGRALEPADEIHAMPGQCLRTFERARGLGVRTVLNHATGPAGAWAEIMRPEYERVGLRLEEATPYDAAWFERERREYALADLHCCASTVVRDQLAAAGIDPRRIWVVPYGADPEIFHARGATRPPEFRIVFAGQLGLRKGLRTLLRALELAGAERWGVDCYGAVLGEAARDLAAYAGRIEVRRHGPVPAARLAEEFRRASVLVLPSLEEGFGLVVAQALACGLPALVSDRVGAKDLLRPRQNGSVFPVGDPAALLEELRWWAANPTIVTGDYSWSGPAQSLLAQPRPQPRP